MTDREKVIKGLECCVLRDPDDKRRCDDCPYRHPDGVITNSPCVNGLMGNALSLLKEYVYGTRYVPVVRCYECQHWEPENAEEFATCGHCRKQYGMSEGNVTDGTWFCSDGERDEPPKEET